MRKWVSFKIHICMFLCAIIDITPSFHSRTSWKPFTQICTGNRRLLTNVMVSCVRLIITDSAKFRHSSIPCTLKVCGQSVLFIVVVLNLFVLYASHETRTRFRYTLKIYGYVIIVTISTVRRTENISQNETKIHKKYYSIHYHDKMNTIRAPI